MAKTSGPAGKTLSDKSVTLTSLTAGTALPGYVLNAETVRIQVTAGSLLHTDDGKTTPNTNASPTIGWEYNAGDEFEAQRSDIDDMQILPNPSCTLKLKWIYGSTRGVL